MKKRGMLLVVIILLSWSAAWATYGYTMGAEPENTALTAPFATAPAYVAPVSGDLQPFSGQPAMSPRRSAPPSTGGEDPVNPDIRMPIGDVDWVCALLPLGYLAIAGWRRYHRKSACE